MAGIATEKNVKEKTGMCCTWAFYKTHPSREDKIPVGIKVYKVWTALEIAELLGIHPSTVTQSRAAMRSGKLHCNECENCMKKAAKEAKLAGETLVPIPNRPKELQGINLIYRKREDD